MPEDNFTWEVEYKDGTLFSQIGHNGGKNAYEDIDRDRLAVFRLLDRDIGNTILMMKFEPGQKLIWRRRTDLINDTVVHLVGKKQTIDGKRYDGIVAVFPNGNIEATGRWDENHPWFYPVQERSEEA